jgi:DNA (cytosine-5)-methyltransferase 1
MKTYLKNKKERIFLADSELNPSHVTFFETNNADLQNNFRFIDLGAKPTLLNASGNTNFIFRVDRLSADKIDEINSIDSSTKLRDRIIAIEQHGGRFHYVHAEKEAMTHNLKMVDSLMPEIISHILLAFYKNRISTPNC